MVTTQMSDTCRPGRTTLTAVRETRHLAPQSRRLPYLVNFCTGRAQ